MKYILDTNILLRLIEPDHSHHPIAANAIQTLKNQDHLFLTLIQNVSEFWNVCTRPQENNGLNLTVAQTDSHVKRFENLFTVLTETDSVYLNWRELVVKYSISGVNVLDARIVAAMRAHGIDQLLTFNTSDFRRYDEITAISPIDVNTESVKQ